MPPVPIMYPISPFLFKEVQSWKERVFLSGFFFLDVGEAKIDVKFVAKSIYILSFNLMTIGFECNKKTINEFIEEITDKIIDFIKIGISN